MIGKYRVIPHHTMEHEAKVDRRIVNRPTDVSLDDPAIQVMTDLNEITPFCIEPGSSIDAANEKMIACGVRLLFVTAENGDLLGIITSTDVLGEKPVKWLNERGGSRSDIMTRDVMTYNEQLEVIRFEDIQSATVGDVVETMKVIGRQHSLIVEANQKGKEIVRGIISTSQIERQTGIEIRPSFRVNTFADVEKAVMSV